MQILIFSICFSEDYTASKETIPCSRIILFFTFVYSSSFNKPNAYILPRTASFFANLNASKISSCLSFLLFQATDHQIRYGQIQYTLQCDCFLACKIILQAAYRNEKTTVRILVSVARLPLVLKRKRSNFFYKIINCIFFYLQRILLKAGFYLTKCQFCCIVVPVNELRKLEKPVTRAAPAGAVSFLRRILWHQTEILLWIIKLKSNI